MRLCIGMTKGTYKHMTSTGKTCHLEKEHEHNIPAPTYELCFASHDLVATHTHTACVSVRLYPLSRYAVSEHQENA